MKKRVITRRRFLLASGALAASVGLYTWRIEPHWVEVVHRDLPIAHLPESLIDCRLVQLSDLHVGPVVDADYITSAVQSIAQLEPDIVVLTGDLMTCKRSEQVDAATRVMEQLPLGRLATLGVLGNHDYGKGYQFEDTADLLTSRLSNLGIEVLSNETRHVDGLQVVGVDDLWAPRFDLDSAMEKLDPKRPSLALSHNPDSADRPGWGDFKGWILCGHTHGGQCRFPYLTPPILPVQNKRYTSGEIDLGDGRRLYINRGLGYLRRVRFCARPEITVFRLTTVQSDAIAGE